MPDVWIFQLTGRTTLDKGDPDNFLFETYLFWFFWGWETDRLLLGWLSQEWYCIFTAAYGTPDNFSTDRLVRQKPKGSGYFQISKWFRDKCLVSDTSIWHLDENLVPGHFWFVSGHLNIPSAHWTPAIIPLLTTLEIILPGPLLIPAA